MHNKNILIYIDHYSRCPFFVRLSDAIYALDYNSIIVTCKLSVYLFFKLKNRSVFLIKKNTCEDIFEGISDSIDVLRGRQTKSQANLIYQNTFQLIEEIDKLFYVEIFFLWNGSSTCDLAIHNFAINNKRKTLYFEIANLPGKLFVDPKGVNARSYLYEKPTIIDDLPVDENAFKQWLKTTFYEDKKKPPKQAKLVTKLNSFALIDRVGLYLFNTQRIDQTSLIRQLKCFFLLKYIKLEFDSFDFTHPFVFLPLQVCSDTQLLINSDIDNEQAIILAKEEADLLNLPLLVKPHPAEDSFEFLAMLNAMRIKYGFFLISSNTINLIEHAELIVVNNSTVGLEALLLDKKIKILGRAIYEQFNRRRLISYIQNYLLDCDYFDNKKIPFPLDIARACLDRATKMHL